MGKEFSTIKRVLLFFCFFFSVANLQAEEDSLLQTADLLYLEGLHPQALELYSKWLPLKSSQRKTVFPDILFRTASLIEEPQLSIQLLERYIPQLNQKEDRFKGYLIAGTEADLIGDILKAHDCYQNALSISQKEIDSPLPMRSQKKWLQSHWQVAYYCAAAAAEMGNRKEAAERLKPIVKSCPNRSIKAFSIMLYSRLLAELGQRQESIRTAEMIFKLNLKRWPSVAQYWIEFLIREYPKDTVALNAAYQAVVKKGDPLLVEAVPTPSMILSGLFKKAEEKKEGVSSSSKKKVHSVKKKVVQPNDKKTVKKEKRKEPEKKRINLIQVGSFKDRSNADFFSKDVQKKNFDSFVSYSSQTQYYRVFVRPRDAESIETLLIQLKDSGFEGYLVFE